MTSFSINNLHTPPKLTKTLSDFILYVMSRSVNVVDLMILFDKNLNVLKIIDHNNKL